MRFDVFLEFFEQNILSVKFAAHRTDLKAYKKSHSKISPFVLAKSFTLSDLSAALLCSMRSISAVSCFEISKLIGESKVVSRSVSRILSTIRGAPAAPAFLHEQTSMPTKHKDQSQTFEWNDETHFSFFSSCSTQL